MKMSSDNPGVHALLLAAIAFVAALFLVIGNLVTKSPISQRQYEDLVRSLQIVIPEHLHDNDPTQEFVYLKGWQGRPVKIYRARRKGRITAVAFERYISGYSKIHLVMALDVSGKVLGVRVLDHEETPGLGDRIEIEKSDWITKFDGRSLDNTSTQDWGVKKDGGVFDQFTGATITPRAVVKAVHEGLVFFRQNKVRILTSPATGNRDEYERRAGS